MLQAALIVIGILAVAVLAPKMAQIGGPALRDAALKAVGTLPNGTTPAYTGVLDTGKTTDQGTQCESCEFLVSGPALAVGELADASTMTYAVVMDDNADLSSPTVLYDVVLKQTGAGGAGAAAATARFKIPSNAERYIAVRATNSATLNASAKSMSLEILH